MCASVTLPLDVLCFTRKCPHLAIEPLVQFQDWTVSCHLVMEFSALTVSTLTTYATAHSFVGRGLRRPESNNATLRRELGQEQQHPGLPWLRSTISWCPKARQSGQQHPRLLCVTMLVFLSECRSFDQFCVSSLLTHEGLWHTCVAREGDVRLLGHPWNGGQEHPRKMSANVIIAYPDLTVNHVCRSVGKTLSSGHMCFVSSPGDDVMHSSSQCFHCTHAICYDVIDVHVDEASRGGSEHLCDTSVI